MRYKRKHIQYDQYRFCKTKINHRNNTKEVVFTIDTNVTENGAFDAKIPFAITVCDLPTLNKGDADISQTISTKLISEGKVIETKTKEFKVSPIPFEPTRTLIKTVRTDANGLYDFGQVRSFFASENKKYMVERSDVAGYTFFSGNGPDFKFDTTSKFSTDVKSVANTTQVGNIGHIKDALSKIGDTVFEDTNRNGIQDAGEKGIAMYQSHYMNQVN